MYDELYDEDISIENNINEIYNSMLIEGIGEIEINSESSIQDRMICVDKETADKIYSKIEP